MTNGNSKNEGKSFWNGMKLGSRSALFKHPRTWSHNSDIMRFLFIFFPLILDSRFLFWLIVFNYLLIPSSDFLTFIRTSVFVVWSPRLQIFAPRSLFFCRGGCAERRCADRKPWEGKRERGSHHTFKLLENWWNQLIKGYLTLICYLNKQTCFLSKHRLRKSGDEEEEHSNVKANLEEDKRESKI